MAEWVAVCRVDEIRGGTRGVRSTPPGCGWRFSGSGDEVVALSGRCPHSGRSARARLDRRGRSGLPAASLAVPPRRRPLHDDPRRVGASVPLRGEGGRGLGRGVMKCRHKGTDSPSPDFRFTIQSESQRVSQVHLGAIAMPVHDWTRVDAGVFHSFHGAWITHLMGSCNGGLLPAGYYALAEQHASKRIADILTLELSEPSPPWNPVLRDRAVAVADAPPQVDLKLVADAKAAYRTLRRTLTIRHVSGHRVVALLEIISPGNIDRASSVQEFAAKIDSAIEAGLHVLVVDLFAPENTTRRVCTARSGGLTHPRPTRCPPIGP